MILQHLLAVTIAVILDSIIGDPPSWPHPVKWMGSLVDRLERDLNRGGNKKARGMVLVVSVLLLAWGISALITYSFYNIHPAAGILMEAVLISTAIARKSLKEAALTIYVPLKEGNIEEARKQLSYIVGRDTVNLDEPEIVRAAVETVAENISDGVTAPLFWALVGGAPLAIIYRAVNTCDSMVGYKNEKYIDFGWASARLDDLANWIPSRLTAICMLFAHKPVFTTRKQAREVTLRDARKHPSPNSGWGEAAAAAILGVQLGGINHYNGIISIRPEMGEPLVPLEKKHLLLVNKVVDAAVPLFLLLLWLGGMLLEFAFSWL